MKRTSGLRRMAISAVAAAGAAVSLFAAAPAQAAANATSVYVWATDVNIRSCSSLSCPAFPDRHISRMNVTAFCQVQGDTVVDGPYANDWWVEVDAGGPRGWISGVYVRGGDNYEPIPGVSTDFADCPF